MTQQKRFILIDHSIINSSGHHLEYALRVLRAAKQLRYHTELWVNKDCARISEDEIDSLEFVFTSSMWKIQGSCTKYRLIYNYFMGRRALCKLYTDTERFYNEFEDYFLMKNINNNDLIFIPTLGMPELICIVRLIDSMKLTGKNFHIVLRRDIFKNLNYFDLKKKFHNRIIDDTLSEIAYFRCSKNINFYTDTDILTHNYNALGYMYFKTLPIPIDDKLLYQPKKQNRNLTISYLGDARDEKGYYLLPNLINSVINRYGAGEGLQFLIQSNLAHGGNKKSAAALLILKSLKCPNVDLVYGPLDSAQYKKFLLQSDIILLPYDASQYKARSSGIMAEALAVGIICVYPDNTWMSKVAKGQNGISFGVDYKLRDALFQVIDNYAENKRRAIEFSVRWRKKNSPERLIETLSGKTK